MNLEFTDLIRDLAKEGAEAIILNILQVDNQCRTVTVFVQADIEEDLTDNKLFVIQGDCIDKVFLTKEKTKSVFGESGSSDND